MINRGLCAYLALGVLCLIASMGFLSCATSGGPAASASRASANAPAGAPVAPAKVWRLSEVSVSYPDGMLSAVFKYAYDADGRLVKEEEYSPTMVPVGTKEYRYSDDGSVVVTQLGNAGEVLGKTRREFVADRLIRETLLNAKDEVQSTVTYAYDGKGKTKSRTVVSASGNQVVSEYEWVKDRLSVISIYDAGKNPLRKYARVYGKTGLLEREDEFGPDGALLAKTAYSYDGVALAREIRQNESGAAVSGARYEYDANGNASLIEAQDRLGKAIEVRRQTWVAFEGK